MISREKIVSLCSVCKDTKILFPWGVDALPSKPMVFNFTAMREIKLTQGYVALVDDDDYDYLMQWKWHLKKGYKTLYAIREIKDGKKRSLVYMHRVILNTPSTLEVDHIDHNGLNNQKANIRNCSHSQNKMNSIPTGFYQYLGVTRRNENERFFAQIKVNGRQLFLGYYNTAFEAAKARDKASIKYFGEFANLNFKG